MLAIIVAIAAIHTGSVATGQAASQLIAITNQTVLLIDQAALQVLTDHQTLFVLVATFVVALHQTVLHTSATPRPDRLACQRLIVLSSRIAAARILIVRMVDFGEAFLLLDLDPTQVELFEEVRLIVASYGRFWRLAIEVRWFRIICCCMKLHYFRFFAKFCPFLITNGNLFRTLSVHHFGGFKQVERAN